MADPRESIARLLMDWGCDDESAGQCVSQLLAEFLVVPRSDIVGTEYGWVHDIHGERCEHTDLSKEDALRLAGRMGEAIERPVLPWSSPIPLPEDGR